MNALFKAKQMYAECGLNFERDLGHYLTNGLVVSRPDRFIMAKPIVAAEGDDCWNPRSPDTWYVHCAVGRGALRWFYGLRPFDLPMLAWRRMADKKQTLRVLSAERFARLAR